VSPRAIKLWLLGGAALLGLTGAALGRDTPTHPTTPISRHAPPYVTPLELAHLLAVAAPSTLVVTFDNAPHPMRGAAPATMWGSTDDEFIASVPAGVQLVLICNDTVRLDRVARRLMAMGRSVRVLRGGVPAWEAAMSADPPAPRATAGAARWAQYRYEVALRRAYGEASATPATAPVAPPARPAAGPTAGGTGRREGC
jgi:rhodanese-related sulfurtransferase